MSSVGVDPGPRCSATKAAKTVVMGTAATSPRLPTSMRTISVETSSWFSTAPNVKPSALKRSISGSAAQGAGPGAAPAGVGARPAVGAGGLRVQARGEVLGYHQDGATADHAHQDRVCPDCEQRDEEAGEHQEAEQQAEERGHPAG